MSGDTLFDGTEDAYETPMLREVEARRGSDANGKGQSSGTTRPPKPKPIAFVCPVCGFRLDVAGFVPPSEAFCAGLGHRTAKMREVFE